ncbi:MarR family transcriptional regulator [Sulfurimonas sp.]|jgi:DNA-binding MarR family transcriptional regulator|uniref:MarR family winged helix-turn-helix transcriptional regulator n=1 Tax=Sulfurimonas sp. TaxID=2022749 RepID=UPI0025F6CD82|nr:MarR family transcriptional regulator [Sulfurimonas sp.]
MNANELKLRLDNKDKETCSSDIGYVVLPLIILSQKLLSDISKLLDEEFNLSNSELDVLASLHSSQDEDHTLTPTQLYERLFFSSGGMTKVLNKLQIKEFIIRLENKEDKRSKLVQLTPTGIEILKIALADVTKLEETIFSNVNDNERKQLSNLLFKTLTHYEV